MIASLERGRGIPLPGLRAARCAQKIKRDHMARDLKVNKSTLYRIETGRNAASYALAIDCAAYLRVPLDTLRTYPGHTSSENNMRQH